ncbi:MAG: L-glutamate gamma-semialdehyde dehydrogenase [Planctomycetes bacterium]|nr:L-glutamate gamma-semialdehyde dehydrogenase [Planctomycetota bacterium]
MAQGTKVATRRRGAARKARGAIPPFRNEAFLDFKNRRVHASQEEALRRVRSQLGRTYPLVIDGKEVTTAQTFTSFNPARHDEVIGRFASGGAREAEAAIAGAWKAFESWSAQPVSKRAGVLLKAARILRARRREMNAWLTLEAGKTWPEADGDTAEAIDFLEYYAREAIRYAGPQRVTPVPGEENEMFYIPLGVGVAIPPWNFPAAILMGLTTAPVAAGNCMILKPASATAAIGWQCFDILREAGVPPGVVQFLTGPGGSLGEAIVSHPRIRFINFTGSKEVGIRINEIAAKVPPGQRWLKRVVAEMGGKDAILVAEDADLDAAADGIVSAAFGYQGQKCSACSRAIVPRRVYDALREKIVERTRTISVGAPEDPAHRMGPVINRASFDKIRQHIVSGQSEGRLLTGGKADAAKGFFIEPTVFGEVAPTARLAQEEIFGPVLTLIPVSDFEEGLRVANGTEFGLTGSVYSRDARKLERARSAFHVGNLYLNRKCTGALVGGHPFGGFNMSGTDSKAGGPDYLLLFLQAKSVSRKKG